MELSQCSTAPVCLSKCAFHIHYQRLQAVSVQCEAPTLCRAVRCLPSLKHNFFHHRTTQVLIFKQPTSLNALRRIRLTSPWSSCDRAHLKGILSYTDGLVQSGSYIFFFLLSFRLSLADTADENRTTSAPTKENVEMWWITLHHILLSAFFLRSLLSLSTSHSPSSSFCSCLTGRCFAFRGERGNDEPPIEMIKVSHLKWVFGPG